MGKFYKAAISLLVEKIHEITGFDEYQALVEGDNIKSQRMMSHVNAKLYTYRKIWDDHDNRTGRENADYVQLVGSD